MKALYNYAVIGGDMRQVYLAQEVSHFSGRSCCYALCAVPDSSCLNSSSLTSVTSLKEACSNSQNILCPIPLKRNGFLNQSALKEQICLEQLLSVLQEGQSFFAGNIPPDFRASAAQKGIEVIDFMEDKSLSLFNSIATAEGAICEAIARSPLNLHKSYCAVLGYGKCGNTLAHYLKGMFCHVYVASDTEEKRTQAEIVADKAGSLKEFKALAGEFDFIFNTIPAFVLTEEVLKKMKSCVTIIDIASAPGGVDFQAAQRLGIDAALCPGLPGKYAPLSSARAIKRLIANLSSLKKSPCYHERSD